MRRRAKLAGDYELPEKYSWVYSERLCPLCKEGTIRTKKAFTCQSCQTVLRHYRAYIHAWLEARYGPYERRPDDDAAIRVRSRIREVLGLRVSKGGVERDE